MTRRLIPKEEIVIAIAEDGMIAEPAMGEFYACCIADGETPSQAWTSAGGVQSARQLELKAALDEHPGVQARIEALKVQKVEDLKDKVYGPAIWMIDIAFRECRAKRDRGGMMECVKMRLQASQGVARMQEKASGPVTPGLPSLETGKTPALVGKPTEKSPQSTRNVGAIRQALLEKGLNVAPNEDDDEAA